MLGGLVGWGSRDGWVEFVGHNELVGRGWLGWVGSGWEGVGLVTEKGPRGIVW